ncbi:DUF342 domain-containing protein [Cytobacillus sp. FJAT-53684]|uniref:DUF342 domain-containing protein n=1 Tax=Cytobacillus mangrovibacter TaxID=3299024 RepID=A0ABW6JTG4_9BACI
MDKHFRVLLEKNRLSAKLELIENSGDGFSFSYEEISDFLKKEKITFGIKEEVLEGLCNHSISISEPVIIAEGIPSKDGMDAYLLNEVQNKKEEKRKKFNFRNVIQIPSVKAGQILASIIPPTPGTSGTDVTGRMLPAKNGKPLTIRPGKNVILNGTKFYSTSDGQLSLTNKAISVNPVYEVTGDLDLKTGNIDFIGNVIIRGNIPSGYEVKAGGDIKIFGLVEGANVHAEGNIIISGGVSGGHKGSITAIGNIQAAYLNQANVQAGQDLMVENSILHSHVQAGGSIFCEKALIIGGSISAGKDLRIKEVGNRLFTKTVLQAGEDAELIAREQKLQKEKKELNNNCQKLELVEQKLLQIGKTRGTLSEEQKAFILKQQATKNQLLKQLKDIDDELEKQLEIGGKEDSYIYIYGSVYPNTTLQFGKYAIQIQNKHSNIRYYISSGEIVSDSPASNNLTFQSI